MNTRAYVYTPPPKLVQRHVVTIVERMTDPGDPTRLIDGRKFDHTVEVVIDLEEIVRCMGSRAVKNTSGKCCDGFVVVKRIGAGVRK